MKGGDPRSAENGAQEVEKKVRKRGCRTKRSPSIGL